MKYRISHNTTYQYDETVPVCQNQAHLTPRNDGGQACAYHRLKVRPAPSSTNKRIDYFGNTVSLFSIAHGHKRLSVTATSSVEVSRRTPMESLASPSWEDVRDALPLNLSKQGLETYQFSFASPRVPLGRELAEYASVSFPHNRPILKALKDLNERIHSEFAYDPTATTVSTPVEEVLANRRGVCQDLAHLQIACLRSLGLAARYVSGYLRTVPLDGQPRLVGADASHAWLSVFCGPLDWIDVDPTNNVFAAADHITVAWARDYSDVCPINGMFIGGGHHTMKVAVDVVPMDA